MASLLDSPIPQLTTTNDDNTNHDLGASGLLRRLNNAPNSTRSRRLSDPVASASAAASTPLRPLAVRSRDGSRWLPTPDEQSHRVGSIEQADNSSEPAAGLPLSQHVCTSAICGITRLFETTELLECILCHLDTLDALSLRRVNRHWNSTVQSSPYLRLHFFTYPQWERPPSQYQLLPLSLPGITIEEGEPIHLGQWIKVTLTPDAARRICPEPKQRVRSRSIFEGLRGGLGRSSNDAWPASNSSTPTGRSNTLQYEALHITQPPTLGMQAYLIHQRPGSESTASAASGPASSVPLSLSGVERQRGPPAIAKLSCDAGITLGFLAETAQELLGSQTSGPSDASDVRVVFKAIVSFSQSEGNPRRSTRRNLRTVTRIG